LKRFGLEMDGKYGSDVWSGSSNATGEWPVSYHGTSCQNAESIADVGYKLDKLAKGTRFRCGRGIYSSPNVTTAEAYATPFSKGHKKYKVILQNRVNSANLKKVKNSNYWVSPGDEDIRA
jgi:hypothetical protein